MSAFGDENLVVNGDLMVSVLGWVQNVLGITTASYIVTVIVLAMIGIPIAIGVMSRRWREIPWYAVAPLIVLAAPSALYYDTALVLLTVGVSLAWLRGFRLMATAFVIAMSWTQLPATTIGWSPLFLPVIWIAAAFAIGAIRSDRISVTPLRYTR